MSKKNEIRADFDGSSIIVYQAYSSRIAVPTLEAKRFVPPFSLNRMTWIKPSFLWMMERSNWGQKSGQEYILAVRITRAGWDEALSCGVLTGYEPGAHRNFQDWQTQFDKALVHIQWDPERSLRGADLGCNSIQVGLSRQIIQRLVEEWTLDIQDYTPLVRKILSMMKSGQADKAKKLLSTEKIYPVDSAVARRLNM